MRKSSIALSVALLVTACAADKDRSASVDTTLPNGTTMVSASGIADNMDALADNMEMQADNMDAMADLTTPDTMVSDTYTPTPEYSTPDTETTEPLTADDTESNYGGE
jgi:hypothetical protein